MTVIARCEVRCPACKGTGEYLNGSDEVRCDACGGCGNVVPSTTYRGAVEALQIIGEHARLDRDERGIAEAARYVGIVGDALRRLGGQ